MNQIVRILWISGQNTVTHSRLSKAVTQFWYGNGFKQLPFNYYSTSGQQKGGTSSTSDSQEAAEKKKKKQIPRITLISEGEHVEVSTLEEAQKMASRRNLKLVKIIDIDTKTQRPVYRLMTGHEYLSEELKQREVRKTQKTGFKGEKLLTVSSRIAIHDLQSKAKLAAKWVVKNYEVRVIITRDGAENSKMEQIAAEIEKVAGQEGRIVQKRSSNSDIRFTILPPKKKDSDDGGGGGGKTGGSIQSEEPKTTTAASSLNQQVRSYHSDSA